MKISSSLILLANISRHVIANEYSSVDDGHMEERERAASVHSEDTRETSPASSSSSFDHFEPGMVS